MIFDQIFDNKIKVYAFVRSITELVKVIEPKWWQAKKALDI